MLSPPPYPSSPKPGSTSSFPTPSFSTPRPSPVCVAPLPPTNPPSSLSSEISPRTPPSPSWTQSPRPSPFLSEPASTPSSETSQFDFQLSPGLPLVRDNKFPSLYVMALKEQNFDEFISTKEKALVYFYNTDERPDRVLEAQFAEAANKTNNPNYGFGAVDCLFDYFLCDDHNIKTSPALKLFSNGYDVSTLHDPKNFTTDQMRMLMKMTPVLTQPRLELAKEYLAREDQKPKKKRKWLCF